MAEAAVACGPSRGGRSAIVAALWAAAALLVLIQGAMLGHLRARAIEAARGGEFQLLLPSQDWRFWGIMVPLGLVFIALLVQWRRSEDRSYAALGLVAMLPIALLGRCTSQLAGSEQFDSVRLSDGRLFVVAMEPIWTDSVYDLNEQVGPLGIYWRRAGDLDYSEDGRFITHPHLVASPDGKWLVFARGGIFTDCFSVRTDRLKPCQLGPFSAWNDPDFERDMRVKSARISALTGIRP